MKGMMVVGTLLCASLSFPAAHDQHAFAHDPPPVPYSRAESARDRVTPAMQSVKVRRSARALPRSDPQSPAIGFDHERVLPWARYAKTKYSAKDDGPMSNEAKADAEHGGTVKPVQAILGQEFSITLESNPSTGYRWELAKPLGSEMVEFIGKKYVGPDTDLLGAGGRELWTFKAVAQGETEIALKYVRPWERDIPPARYEVFLIEVR